MFCAGCNIPAIFVNMLNSNEGKHLQNSIGNSGYYLNEKIALTNFIEGHIRLKKYKELRNRADYTMVRNKKDSKPYRMFLVTMGLKLLKRKYIIFRRFATPFVWLP